MYLGPHILGNTLTFYANTQNTAGSAQDASAGPTFRVYESDDAVGTALLTGTMTLFDAANTAGLYRATLDLTTGNGFEVGKRYVIYQTGTVDGQTPAALHYFEVQPRDATLARKILTNRYKIDPVTKIMTTYDDDGTTPLVAWTLYDANGNPSTEEPFERQLSGSLPT